jgi:hypothetical protein
MELKLDMISIMGVKVYDVIIQEVKRLFDLQRI